LSFSISDLSQFPQIICKLASCQFFVEHSTATVPFSSGSSTITIGASTSISQEGRLLLQEV